LNIEYFLLNSLLISLLQGCNVIGSFLGVLDLLPSFHLLLFKKRNEERVQKKIFDIQLENEQKR
jgi:hypothetical protein